MKIPGCITAAEAQARGFTHHGKYYCIPVWLAPENPDFPVATKWAPMEYVMSMFQYIEGFMRSILFPDDEPCFQFVVMGEIRRTGEKA